MKTMQIGGIKYAMAAVAAMVLVGCGTTGGEDSSSGGYSSGLPGSVPAQTSKHTRDYVRVNVLGAKEEIDISARPIGNFYTYILGYTSSEDGFKKHRIEGSTMGRALNVVCEREREDGEAVYYGCYGVDMYGGYQYTGESGIGNELTVYKNRPTYLYEKGITKKEAYVVGFFDYEDGRVRFNYYDVPRLKILD